MDKVKDVEWTDPDILGGRVLVYFYDSLLNISVEYDLCTKLVYISKVKVTLNFWPWQTNVLVNENRTNHIQIEKGTKCIK